MMRFLLTCFLFFLFLFSGIEAQTQVESLAIQPDGKIIAGGTVSTERGNRLALVRFSSDGKLDTTFGAQGIVTAATGKGNKLYALALQEDGYIVAAGYSDTGRSHAVTIIRFTPSGSPDPKFGNAGVVTTESGLSYARAFELVVQPDGKLLAIGHSNTRPAGGFDLLTIRYNRDGSLDRTFGTGGIVHTKVGTQNNGGQTGALQADGKVLVAGNHSDGKNSRFVVARYLPNGSLDLSFGSRGVAILPINGTSNAIMPLKDGRILVAGDDGELLESKALIAVLNADGTLDPRFGDKGVRKIAKGSPRAVRQGPEGTILLTGWDLYEDIASEEESVTRCSIVIRFGLDNSPAMIAGSIEDADFPCSANDIATQSDGKLIAAAGGPLSASFVVLRFRKDGSLDPSFGIDGKAETVF